MSGVLIVSALVQIAILVILVKLIDEVMEAIEHEGRKEAMTLYIQTCNLPPSDYLRAWRCGPCGEPRDPELPCPLCGWVALPEELDHEEALLDDRRKGGLHAR